MKILDVQAVDNPAGRDWLALVVKLSENSEPFRAVLVNRTPDHHWDMISEQFAEAVAFMFEEHPLPKP